MKNRRKPVFYGWWIAVAAGIGLGLGSPPILVFCFPVFLKAMASEFHASRSAISLAFTLHNVVASLGAPIAGRLVDRFGVRKVAIPATLAFALLLIGNRFVTVSMLGVYAFNMMGAFIGMGLGPVPYSTLISKWFDLRRGTALAVMMLGLGAGAVAMPSLVHRMITAVSWRAAYASYGIAMLLVTLPVIAALIKETPSSMGLFPDGLSSPSSRAHHSELEGLTWQEARGTSTFWVMIAAVVLLGASVHACVIHLAAMLTDRGISPQTAALASSVAGSGLLLGRAGTGFLLDRFFGPHLAVCFSSGTAVGILLLLLTHGTAATFLGALVIGLGMGAEGDLIAYLTSRYCGLKAFGEIYGYAFGSFVLAGACGALIMGVGFDRTGSYTAPLIGFLAATSVAVVLFSRLGPYKYVVRQPDETVGRYRVAAAGR